MQADAYQRTQHSCEEISSEMAGPIRAVWQPTYMTETIAGQRSSSSSLLPASELLSELESAPSVRA